LQSVFDPSRHFPFQAFWWLKTFAGHFCRLEDIHLLGIYENDLVIAVGAFEQIGNRVFFLGMKPVLGGQGLTDYGDLIHLNLGRDNLQLVWQEIIYYFQNQNIGQVQLDYIREDSETIQSLKVIKFKGKVTVTKQEVSPFIQLPKTWDGYLAGLERKDRKELKRKLRRIKEVSSLHLYAKKYSKTNFEDFIRLHRLSDPAKKKFMSPKMELFFQDLIRTDKKCWLTQLYFLDMDGKRAAVVLSFNQKPELLLYNSGFDPEYSHYSVGLLLHVFLIRQAIEGDYRTYDFLLGNERYKYDLGAIDRNLYKIIIQLAKKDE
jgi:hypothetical protein